MISTKVKLIAVDKKETGSANAGTRNTVTRNDNTETYIPKDIDLDTLKIGEAYLCYDKNANALKVFGVNDGSMNLYALGDVAALGQSSMQGGGSGGGISYNRLDSWEAYDANKAGWVLSAGLGKNLDGRVTTLENGQIEGGATQEWVEDQGYLTELPVANTNALGAIKIGYSANNKNYPVKLDNNNRAYVSVPWSDTSYGVFGASANGLVPMASTSNKTTAETSANNYYLCADGKFRQLPANAFKDTTYTFTADNPQLSWNTTSKIGTVGGTALNVTMPAKPTYTYSDVGAASSGHTHSVSITTSSGTNALTLAANTKYSLTAGGSTFIFTTPADTNTWRPLGTGANNACAGNDARLSDARPASDVSAWAKASTKPTYTLDEVTDGSTRKLSNYVTAIGTSGNTLTWSKNGVAQSAITVPFATNATNATKLQTFRTINGTSFDGTANITTANWGTARNISIADSDSANIGSAVSVNGSAAVTLKLPATIKATLSTSNYVKIGNAYLTYDSTNNAIRVSANANGTGAANFYALGGVSALGAGSSGSGGSGTSYNRLDSWASYDNSKAGWVLSALLGNDLNSRVTSLENGQIEGVATQEWVEEQGFATESWVSTRGYLTSLAHNHTITIGNASKSVGVGGTANFTLADIGAQAAGNYATSGHIHKVKINGQEKTIAASGGTAVDLGTYLTKHQDISGKADKATTLKGYGITDAKIENGVITLGKNTITPLTSHQSLAAYATTEWVTNNFNKYVLPVAGTAIGGVKSGTDITVDANGNVSVNNNSHKHTWSNISDAPTSLPASDVSAWAKKPTKPNYTLDEITDGSTRKLSNYATAADVKTLQGYFTSGVANKANVLNTSRTIWGQSFNGSANVSGAMTGVTSMDGLIYFNTNNNYIGIGTTSPNYKLDVTGVIHSTAGMFSDDYVSALGQNTSSDERLKDIKGDIDLSVGLYANAPSKLFEWKNNKELGTQVGTIAQYWQRELPQVVHDRGDGYLAMQYDVTALLGTITIAKKVVEQEDKIKELEETIEKLRNEIDMMKKG